jgi:hypothetical protein
MPTSLTSTGWWLPVRPKHRVTVGATLQWPTPSIITIRASWERHYTPPIITLRGNYRLYCHRHHLESYHPLRHSLHHLTAGRRRRQTQRQPPASRPFTLWLPPACTIRLASRGTRTPTPRRPERVWTIYSLPRYKQELIRVNPGLTDGFFC